MISEETRDSWHDMVGFLSSHQENLEPWDLSFLGGMAALVDRRIDLSFKQSKSLRRIYKREQARIG